LLTPEKVDSTALQTDSSVKSKGTHEDLESEKMAEIMEDNKEYAQTAESSTAVSKKKTNERASITGQLRVSSSEVDDIINAPIDKVENVLEKEDGPSKSTAESDDKQSQKELNKSTLASLAGGEAPADTPAEGGK